MFSSESEENLFEGFIREESAMKQRTVKSSVYEEMKMKSNTKDNEDYGPMHTTDESSSESNSSSSSTTSDSELNDEYKEKKMQILQIFTQELKPVLSNIKCPGNKKTKLKLKLRKKKKGQLNIDNDIEAMDESFKAIVPGLKEISMIVNQKLTHSNIPKTSNFLPTNGSRNTTDLQPNTLPITNCQLLKVSLDSILLNKKPIAKCDRNIRKPNKLSAIGRKSFSLSESVDIPEEELDIDKSPNKNGKVNRRSSETSDSSNLHLGATGYVNDEMALKVLSVGSLKNCKTKDPINPITTSACSDGLELFDDESLYYFYPCGNKFYELTQQQAHSHFHNRKSISSSHSLSKVEIANFYFVKPDDDKLCKMSIHSGSVDNLQDFADKSDHWSSNEDKPEFSDCTSEDMDNLRMKSIRDTTKLTCKKCDKYFSSAKEFLFHRKQHGNQAGLKCCSCAKSFVTKTALKQHLLECQSQPISCELCDEYFEGKALLKKHQKKHSGTDALCLICPKQFLSKSQLELHMKIHKNEHNTVHSCNTCGKTFSYESDLQLHEQKHFNRQPFKCRPCNLTFAERRQLSEHIKCHCSDTAVKCKQCQEAFVDMDGLKQHISKCHMVYRCSGCQTNFTNMPMLVDHCLVCPASGHLGTQPLMVVQAQEELKNYILKTNAPYDDVPLSDGDVMYEIVDPHNDFMEFKFKICNQI